MKKKFKGKTILVILLCVVWLGLIFYNGTRQGEISQKSSKQFINVVSRFMKVPSEGVDQPGIKFSDVNFYVRKNAHFFQYLVLSILMCSTVSHFKLCKSSKIFLLPFLLLFFPVIDEFIQKFIPGRTSNIFDVIIDFSGGILGMLIFKIHYKVHKKKVQVQL